MQSCIHSSKAVFAWANISVCNLSAIGTDEFIEIEQCPNWIDACITSAKVCTGSKRRCQRSGARHFILLDTYAGASALPKEALHSLH